jgi:hypothetical protein
VRRASSEGRRVDLTEITRSGGYDPNGPDASFWADFFTHPHLHLPPGQWKITAMAGWEEGGCGGIGHGLSASLTIHVTED